MEQSFNLISWSAWSEKRTDKSEWLCWAKSEGYQSANKPIDLSALPAIKRRRLSSLSKMAFFTASTCLQGISTPPICIFASQHGELKRTIKIIKAMAAQEQVSPTDFSLSVHNTGLGLFSIFTNNTQPSTTVVAGEDTFGYALMEANNYLSRFPEESVLVVYFDEPLPQELSQFSDYPQDPFSIALLLNRASDNKISFSYSSRDSNNVKEMQSQSDLGEEFLKFYLADEEQRKSITKRSLWTWRRSQ